MFTKSVLLRNMYFFMLSLIVFYILQRNNLRKKLKYQFFVKSYWSEAQKSHKYIFFRINRMKKEKNEMKWFMWLIERKIFLISNNYKKKSKKKKRKRNIKNAAWTLHNKHSEKSVVNENREQKITLTIASYQLSDYRCACDAFPCIQTYCI